MVMSAMYVSGFLGDKLTRPGAASAGHPVEAKGMRRYNQFFLLRLFCSRQFYHEYPEPCFVSTRLPGHHCGVAAYRSPSMLS